MATEIIVVRPQPPVAKPTAELSYSFRGEHLSHFCYIGDLLISACFLGHSEQILQLREMGANINVKDKITETTPLIAAAQGGHCSVVEMLCNMKGIDVNAKDCRNNSALYYAVMMGSVRMIESLCQKSADTQIFPDMNALELAISCGGDPDVVSTLTDYVVSTGKNAKTKKTPLELAQFLNCQDLIEFLKPAVYTNDEESRAKRGFTAKQTEMADEKQNKFSMNKTNNALQENVPTAANTNMPLAEMTCADNIKSNCTLEDEGLTSKEIPDTEDCSSSGKILSPPPRNRPQTWLQRVTSQSFPENRLNLERPIFTYLFFGNQNKFGDCDCDVHGTKLRTQKEKKPIERNAEENNAMTTSKGQEGKVAEKTTVTAPNSTQASQDRDSAERKKNSEVGHQIQRVVTHRAESLESSNLRVDRRNTARRRNGAHKEEWEPLLRPLSPVPGATVCSHSGACKTSSIEQDSLSKKIRLEETRFSPLRPFQQQTRAISTRAVTKVMKGLPPGIPVSISVTQHVHKYNCKSVQQIIKRATNGAIDSTMNITGEDTASLDSSSICSADSSSSPGSVAYLRV